MTVGTKNRLAFSVAEATFGTAPVIAGAKAWPFKGQRPIIKPVFISDDGSLTGQMEVGRETVLAGITTSWNVELDFRLDCLGFFLFWLLGADTVSGVGPYTHLLSTVQTDITSRTLFWVDANTTAGDVEQFPGCKPTKLTIGGKAGGAMYIKVEGIGAGTHAQAANTMVANNTDVINPFSNIATYNVGGTLDLAAFANPTGGTNYLNVLEDFEIVLERIFEPNNEYVAGSISLPALETVGLKVTWKGTHKWQENALSGLIQIIEAGTKETLFLKMANGANSAALALPRVYFNDTTVSGQRNKLKKPFTFEAKYDDTAALSIKAQVINGTASYS